MEKQTPVEWLALRYHHRQGYLSQDDIAEAKQMEKQQMIEFAENMPTKTGVTQEGRPYELWQLETYGNYYEEDETQHDVEPNLD
jgi:hypothetical protein